MKKITIILLSVLFSLSITAQPSSDKWIRQGASYHDQGRYMEAISCYQKALKINPSSMSAIYEMSLSYLQMGDYDNAINRSTQVINVGFKALLVDAYVVKGTALAAQNKFDEAISLFQEAIKECGGEYLLYYNLGLTYYNKKDTVQALVNLKKAIELDATHSGAFLLYAYASNDLGYWIESIYSLHFFLLLEPNTKRSVDGFTEMFDILSAKLDDGSEKLQARNGVDRKRIYDLIQKSKPTTKDLSAQYKFFVEASQIIFRELGKNKPAEPTEDIFWTLFVPVFEEILDSGHFETYCRYVSVSCFTESFEWWEQHKKEVDEFIHWFEKGNSLNVSEEGEIDEEYVEGEE